MQDAIILDCLFVGNRLYIECTMWSHQVGNKASIFPLFLQDRLRNNPEPDGQLQKHVWFFLLHAEDYRCIIAKSLRVIKGEEEMKKSIILLAVVAIIALVCVVSCKQEPEDQAIGSWTRSETIEGVTVTMTFTFSKGGAVEVNTTSGSTTKTMEGSYKAESATKGTLTVKVGELTESGTYSINGSTMTITFEDSPKDFQKLLK